MNRFHDKSLVFHGPNVERLQERGTTIEVALENGNKIHIIIIQLYLFIHYLYGRYSNIYIIY